MAELERQVQYTDAEVIAQLQLDVDKLETALKGIKRIRPSLYQASPGSRPAIVRAFEATREVAGRALSSLDDRRVERLS